MYQTASPYQEIMSSEDIWNILAFIVHLLICSTIDWKLKASITPNNQTPLVWQEDSLAKAMLLQWRMHSLYICIVFCHLWLYFPEIYLIWSDLICPPGIYSFMHVYLVTQVNLVPGRRPFQELQRRACPPRCAPRSWTGWWCTPADSSTDNSRPPSPQLWQSRLFGPHTPRLRWCSPK